MFDVADDADDFRLNIEQPDVDALADGIDVRKIFARERRVNHRDSGRMFVVAVTQEAPALNRNAHGLLIRRRHQIKKRKRHIVLVGGRRLAFEPERNFGIAGHGQRAADHGDGFHSGDAFELPQAFSRYFERN